MAVDGRRVPLVVVSHRTSERPGAGGLKTMRFDAVFRAAATGTRLTFADTAYANRIGWREIVVTARDGAEIVAKLGARDEPLERAPRLPEEPAPVAARRPHGLGDLPPGTVEARRPDDRNDARTRARSGGFESLIQRGDLSLGVVLLSLLIAAFWGSVHALTPGHGKALVAGLPRRHEGQAAARIPARRHGDGHAHGRCLRARARDARCSRSSSSPSSCTRG